MVTLYNVSDVFISYSRKDKVVAKKIGDVLYTRGYEIWADWEDIPQSVDWWDEIQAGIESASIFAFMISPDSAQSDVCRQEIEHAVQNNKRIVPILLRELGDEHIDNLHEGIRTHNWMIFDATTDTAFETSLQQLIQVFAMDIEHLRAHTRFLVRAKEWVGRNRDDSFLLRGLEALESETWLNQASEKDPPPTPLHYQYIASSNQQRLQDEFMEKQQNLLLFVERRALPTFLIAGGSAASFIFITMRYKEELNLLNQLTIAMGAMLINGLFMAAIGLFADDLVRIRFRERLVPRLIASLIYSIMFGSAVSGVTQLVNYGSFGFHWGSIFIMGFFFGLGFSLRAAFNLNVWLASFLICFSIQFGSLLTVGIGENDTSYLFDFLRPVFHYETFRDYFIIGYPMAFLQAVGVYAGAMWHDVQGLLMQREKSTTQA